MRVGDVFSFEGAFTPADPRPRMGDRVRIAVEGSWTVTAQVIFRSDTERDTACALRVVEVDGCSHS